MKLFRLSSPLGAMLLSEEGGQICGLHLEGQKHLPRELPCPEPCLSPLALQVQHWLDSYFEGKRPDPALLPLAPGGSPFQRRLWAELLQIPYGESRSYRELAEGLGSSPRGVGAAIGRNPLLILIPCHRVLSAGQGIGGWCGGIEAKRRLLELEEHTSELQSP